MLRRERAQRIPRHLRVVMAMVVDETRRHREPIGVDRPCRRAIDFADFDDLAVLHCKVAAECRHPRAIDDAAITDQQVVRHLVVLPCSGSAHGGPSVWQERSTLGGRGKAGAIFTSSLRVVTSRLRAACRVIANGKSSLRGARATKQPSGAAQAVGSIRKKRFFTPIRCRCTLNTQMLLHAIRVLWSRGEGHAKRFHADKGRGAEASQKAAISRIFRMRRDRRSYLLVIPFLISRSTAARSLEPSRRTISRTMAGVTRCRFAK